MAGEKYLMSEEFAKSVAVLLCTDRDFYSTLASAINPSMLPDTEAEFLATVAIELGSKLGHGPSFQGVCQAVKVKLIEGKIKKGDANNALDVLAEHVPTGAEEVRIILADMLRREARRELVRDAVDMYGKGRDLIPLIEAARKVEGIGIKNLSSIGTVLGPSIFDEILTIRNIDKMPTGILDLDIVLGGGAPRGTQTIFIGPSGAGKSMTLSSIGAYGLLHGHTVAYASLELHRTIIAPRIIAAVIGMPINAVVNESFDVAKSQLDAMAHRLGACVIEKFDPGSTTMLDIEAWVQRTEEVLKRRIDILLIDYLDKMGSHVKEDYGSSYKAQNSIAERMRTYAERTGKWCFTASQPKRKDAKNKQTQNIIEGDDIADSMGKVRVADIVISLNPTPDRQGYIWYIDKHRTHDCAGISVGPIPHERHMGRIASFPVGPNSMIIGVP